MIFMERARIGFAIAFTAISVFAVVITLSFETLFSRYRANNAYEEIELEQAIESHSIPKTEPSKPQSVTPVKADAMNKILNEFAIAMLNIIAAVSGGLAVICLIFFFDLPDIIERFLLKVSTKRVGRRDRLRLG
jgi:hypothetical protein